MQNGVVAIIVTYNGDEVLIENMQALLNQCEKVIIVDNNSTEDMSEAFKFAEDNNIEIIKNNENLGVSYFNSLFIYIRALGSLANIALF